MSPVHCYQTDGKVLVEFLTQRRPSVLPVPVILLLLIFQFPASHMDHAMLFFKAGDYQASCFHWRLWRNPLRRALIINHKSRIKYKMSLHHLLLPRLSSPISLPSVAYISTTHSPLYQRHLSLFFSLSRPGSSPYFRRAVRQWPTQSEMRPLGRWSDGRRATSTSNIQKNKPASSFQFHMPLR